MKSSNNQPNNPITPQGIDFKRALPIIILLALGVFVVFFVLRNNDSDANNDAGDEQRSEEQQENQEQAEEAGITIGDVVAAEGVDSDGCAVNTTSNFDGDTSQFYIVAEDSDIPSGSSVFVRLYRDGQAVEDLPEITAAEDYENTCINFVFESTSTFEPGDYEAEFVINGNRMGSVQFEVQ